MDVALFIAGAATLMLGAELLVRGITRLASALGLRPRASAFALAALVASGPVLAVGGHASASGLPDVALGSVIGGSIFNLLFLLGSAALVAPLFGAHRRVRLQTVAVFGAALLLFALGQDGEIARWDGVALLVLLAVYVALLFRAARQEEAVQVEEPAGGEGERHSWRMLDPGWLLAGAGLLVIGSGWTVRGVVGIAALLGASAQLVALLLVGSMTSLPAITSALQAAIRGRVEIVAGAVLGGSTINLLAGVGLASLSAPAAIEFGGSLLSFDLPVVIAAAAAATILLRSDRLQSYAGAFFLVGYLGYVQVRLWMDARPELLSPLGGATVLFIILIAGPVLAVVLRGLLRAARTDLPRSVQHPSAYFCLPPNRVAELGKEVEF